MFAAGCLGAGVRTWMMLHGWAVTECKVYDIQYMSYIYMSFRMPSGMSDRMPQRRLQCMLDRCPRRGLLEENNLIR